MIGAPSPPPAACPVCGFVRAELAGDEVSPRVAAAVEAFVDVVTRAGDVAGSRPEPARWSILEYGAHLRDVLLSLRERTLPASIEDHPTGSPIHRDQRVDLGFYGLDSAATLSAELPVCAGLLLRTWAALPLGFEDRPLLYSPVTPEEVTVGWLGTVGVHECEHHLADARENLSILSG